MIIKSNHFREKRKEKDPKVWQSSKVRDDKLYFTYNSQTTDYFPMRSLDFSLDSEANSSMDNNLETCRTKCQ